MKSVLDETKKETKAERSKTITEKKTEENKFKLIDKYQHSKIGKGLKNIN